LGEVPSSSGSNVKFVAIFRHVHVDLKSDDEESDNEIGFISKPQDPLKAVEFAHVVIETKLRDYTTKIENLISDLMSENKVDEKLINEKLHVYQKKLHQNVEFSFAELKARMEQFSEKESLLKRDMTELLDKYKKLEEFSQELQKELTEDYNPTSIGTTTNTSSNISSTNTPTTPTKVVHNPKLWKLSDFEQLQTLGTGTFGRVKLCKRDGQYFAMKILSKQKILKLKQIDHTKNEIHIQKDLIDSPFCIDLYTTFQDEKNVYLILEYIAGGELLTWISIQKKFPENMAKFFAAEILLALEAMHSKDIAYRDLKPENILLSETGHAKLCDFGFAKTVKDKTYTTCGTPEYLAPEVILGGGHDKMVDFYSLGALIFEMLTGKVPFEEQDRYKLFELILKGNVAFPEFVSKNAKVRISFHLQTLRI
jgi:hypothetical protein